MIIRRLSHINKINRLLRQIPRKLFARNFSKPEDSMDMQDLQKANFQAYFPKYFGLAMHKHEDIYIQEQVLGKKCYICGSTPNNFHSATYMNQIINFLKPQQVILGGLLQQKISRPKGTLKSMDPDSLCKPENLYCKQALSELLQQLKFQQPNFYYHPKYKNVLMIDHQNKRIFTNDYLTIAYEALKLDTVKISFGLPLQIVIFEDLILSHSVQQLRKIFDRTAQKALSKYPGQYMYNPTIILQTLQHLALQHEPTLHSKQVVFLASLLRRYCKVQNQILMVVPAQHVRKIAELVHSVTMKPQQVFRNFLQQKHSENFTKLQNILNDQNGLDQILEKFAILSILKDNYLEHELILRKDIFSESIFAPIFKNLNIETQILPRYKKIQQIYTQKVFNVQAERMKLIENKYVHNPKRLSLIEQLKLVDERKNQLPYTYIVQNNQIVSEQNLLIQQMHRRMKMILLQQNRMIEYKQLMDYFEGKFSKENIMVYSKVVGEAIVTMPKKPRLPVYHFAAFRGKYKEQLKNYILNNQNKVKSNNDYTISHTQKLKQLQEKYKDKIKFIQNQDEALQYLTGKKGRLIKTFNMEESEQQANQKIPTLQQFENKYKNIEDLLDQLSSQNQNIEHEQQDIPQKPKIKPGQSRSSSRRSFRK